ncbi:hypothetical protein BH10CHL1_BH10CHL1_21730 [soil metagenome]
MRHKRSLNAWPIEWILLALVLASVVGYFCWTLLPPLLQNLLITMLLACLPLAMLALLLSGIRASTKDQESSQRAWQHFAEQANVTFQLQPWRSAWSFFEGQQFCEWAIQGVYQQRTMTVERVKIYLGRNTFYVTQGTISFQNSPHKSFSFKRRGFSGIIANLLSSDRATVEQRELETRFTFEGEPVSLVAQLLENQSLRKLLMDPFWLSVSSLTGASIRVAAESLHFCAPACHTEKELQELLNRLYALAALLEQAIARTHPTL